jgi:glycosyltransferase involved in cell wall biosynthesis
MLEFMSCAKPVILGVDGQARQILHEARAGVTIEPENAVALADAIRRLKADPTACRTFGRNARGYIMERCSRQQSAKQYVEVLQEVLERST